MLDLSLHYCILSVQAQRLNNHGVKANQGVAGSRPVRPTIYFSFLGDHLRI